MKPVVFIHTNDHQLLAAKVSSHSLKSRSRTPDDFEIRLLRLEETPHLCGKDNQQFRWWEGGTIRTWHKTDRQAFAPLRRMVPQIMGFEGKALVLDPDIFAVGDVCELLSRDMCGKAILCRKHTIRDGLEAYASSVMLLDCAKLKHWTWDREIDDIFAGKINMGPWHYLLTEPPETIGLIEEEWNHFDTLNEKTKLLHNTELSTQPWRTGLPVRDAPTPAFYRRILRRVLRRRARNGSQAELVCRPHPDQRQERLFFSLLRECLETQTVPVGFLYEEIRQNHLRKDALQVLETLFKSPS